MADRKAAGSPLARFSGLLFAAALLGLLLFASLSDPPARDAAYLHNALIKERQGFDLLGDANARRVGHDDYLKELRTAQDADHLNTNVKHVALVREVAGAIIQQAIKLYPTSETWDWEVHVINTGKINATCREGGKIIVYGGLIELLEENPDRIATVLGHEVAHAILGHSRSTVSKSGLVKATTWVIAESLKMGPQRKAQASEMLTLALLHPQSRRQEREADVLGVELAVRAGFDYTQASMVWRKFMTLGERSGSGTHFLADREESFTSDHPIDAERITLIEQLAPRIGALKNTPEGIR